MNEVKIIILHNRRDVAIRELWLMLNRISQELSLDSFTDEDLEVWGAITKHSAIQLCLDKAIEKTRNKK